jgi:acyl carrier protein
LNAAAGCGRPVAFVILKDIETGTVMKLEELFATVLREPVAALSDTASPTTVRSWDSLRHIELVMAAEAQYGVRFETSEVVTIRTLGCMRDLLEQKGITT